MVEPITELYCYSGIMKPWVPVAVRHLQILRTLDFLPMDFILLHVNTPYTVV